MNTKAAPSFYQRVADRVDQNPKLIKFASDAHAAGYTQDEIGLSICVAVMHEDSESIDVTLN